ncbi:MAG: MFS transporter [Lewinellaceae bacterium]|nr:MFS transporter [Lewinellaceae bacterium]
MSRYTLFSRTVWLLALVSLCTDLASEMLYPILPLFFSSIGFSAGWIGLLEGTAEALAGISKGYFGRWSDLWGRQVPFVRFGYTLSALAKPLMAAWPAAGWVLFTRSTDRLGKGIRTGARDALLATEATPQTRGQIFGFHRSMDTLGAVLGPLLALLFLYWYPENYRMLFFLALFPGLGAIALSFLLKDKPGAPAPVPAPPSPGAPWRFWQGAPPAYRRLLPGLLLFALFNSSDLFLLLRLRDAGMGDQAVVGLYIFYNLCYALAAYPAGKLADRWGMRPTFSVGLVLFAVVYLGMALSENAAFLLVLLGLYGLYAAFTEGVAKAWISNLVPKENTGAAIGMYTGMQSLALLLASLLTGGLWEWQSPAVALLFSGGGAIAALLYLQLAVSSKVQPA